MIVMPIVYVGDIDASIAFYERLGLELDAESRTRGWAELRSPGGGMLALHVAEGERAGSVELCFTATEPLERVVGEDPELAIIDEA